MIEVKNLVKRYGNHLAVNDLSFTVEKGQIYGFLGPNGAGKTTTMNVITGYISSTEGEVVINGHNILEEPEEAKKHIGYLPELPPLYFEMTIIEYLKFAADLKKIPKKDRAKMIEEVMELVKITDVQGRLIKNLSKGYKQRVGLAQAILGYPEIIILDEPTVGLDPKQIIEIRDLIKALSEKHTVILSSHILSEVSAICDYVMIISNGKLVASDTPDNLSKLAQGSNVLEMTVKSSKADMENLLKDINDMEAITYQEAGDEILDIQIKTNERVDLREQLFYLCAENKKTILRMQANVLSLEDVFLELTKSEIETETEIDTEESLSDENTDNAVDQEEEEKE